MSRLGLEPEASGDGWDVYVPLHRFDIAIEADLIEEIARIHGYDEIPETAETASTLLETVTESAIEIDSVAATLIARDYQEVVTYSFVDAELDQMMVFVNKKRIRDETNNVKYARRPKL